MALREREDGEQWRNTPRYIRLRDWLLDRQPLCEICERQGRLGVAAKEMDHKHAVALGGDKWDEDNLQALCVECHAKKSDTEKQKSSRPKSWTCTHGSTLGSFCPDCGFIIE